MDAPLPTLTGRRRTRRAVAIVAVAAVFASTVVYWLASSGATSTNVSAAPGLNAKGQIADIASLSSAVTGFANGNASQVTGVAIAKLTIAKAYTAPGKARVSIVWTDPKDAARVLNNPHAQISFGLYKPVSTTSSTCSTAGAVKVTDGATSYCAVLDTGATGSASVSTSGSTQGTLLLADSLLSGYLRSSFDGSGSTPAGCAADSGSPTAWCQPSDIASGNGLDQRRLFVVASILVPGGTPHGQQSQAGSLVFNVTVQSS